MKNFYSLSLFSFFVLFEGTQFAFSQTVPQKQIVCVGNYPDKRIVKKITKLLGVFFIKGKNYPDRIKLKDEDKIEDYETLIQDVGDIHKNYKDDYPIICNILRALTVQPIEIDKHTPIAAHRREITGFLEEASQKSQENWQKGDCAVLRKLGVMAKAKHSEVVSDKGKKWLKGCIESLKINLIKGN